MTTESTPDLDDKDVVNMQTLPVNKGFTAQATRLT